MPVLTNAISEIDVGGLASVGEFGEHYHCHTIFRGGGCVLQHQKHPLNTAL